MEQLIAALLIGDYSRALHLLDGLEHEGALLELKTEAHEGNPTRTAYAAAVAELYFYIGRNAAAWSFLEDFAVEWNRSRKLPQGIAPRAQLQLAEYFYSHGRYDTAAEVARKVLDGSLHNSNKRGIGEAAYYLMRIVRRLHKYDEVIECRHIAIDAFTAASVREQQDHDALRWRLGLVYLVAGFTQWRAGDLKSSTALLQTAGCLLEGTGDFIARANVRHTMGVLLRSQGRLEEAGPELENARQLYEEAKHKLNLARIHTDIGRLCLDGRQWKGAHDALERALQLCDEHSSPRQRAEALLWKSWLAQMEGSSYRNFHEAEKAAEKSLELARQSLSVQVEAIIALGHCAALRGDWHKAKNWLGKAVRFAEDHRMTKHLASALLTRAEFHARYPPLELAQAGTDYKKAIGILPLASSAFLQGKADGVKQILDGKSAFFVFFDDFKRTGMAANRKALEEWAADRAMDESGGKQNQAARLLRIKPNTLRQMLGRRRSRKRTQT